MPLEVDNARVRERLEAIEKEQCDYTLDDGGLSLTEKPLDGLTIGFVT